MAIAKSPSKQSSIHSKACWKQCQSWLAARSICNAAFERLSLRFEWVSWQHLFLVTGTFGRWFSEVNLPESDAWFFLKVVATWNTAVMESLPWNSVAQRRLFKVTAIWPKLSSTSLPQNSQHPISVFFRALRQPTCPVSQTMRPWIPYVACSIFILYLLRLPQFPNAPFSVYLSIFLLPWIPSVAPNALFQYFYFKG